MAKITRKTAQIFGSIAGANQIAKFGSLAASAPVLYSGATADPANIQALGNWLQGWFAGVEGPSSPAIEDMNAFCYVMAYQVAYGMQQGIPEWDPATTYYIGGFCSNSSGIYVSITNNNLNNAVNDLTNWRPLLNTRTRTATTNGTNPGLGGICVSSPVPGGGGYQNTTTTFTQVTNLTCTVTTVGNPVNLSLSGGFLGASHTAGSGAPSSLFRFLNGSTQVGVDHQVSTTSASNASISVPSGSMQCLDMSVAGIPGTYTYHVFGAIGTPSPFTGQIAQVSAGVVFQAFENN